MIEEVQTVLKRIRYKKDTRFSVCQIFYGFTIYITKEADNAYIPGKIIPIIAQLRISPEMVKTPNLIIDRIYYCLKQLEMHEMQEWFMVDDVRIHDPHASDSLSLR